MSTELIEVTRAVAEFDRVAAGLAELRGKYHGVVYDVRTSVGMKDAIEARRAVREPRLEVERIRKAAKAPILALGKRLDSEAARITKELEELECPISDQIKTEETRKEVEKQAKIAAELARVQRLQERVAELRGNRSLSAHSGSALIAEHICDLEGIAVDDSFEEFRQSAEDAKAAGLSWLQEVHAAALAHEAEQVRIKAEREELARLKAEQAKRDAEEAARRQEEEAQRKADREALEAEMRRSREAIEIEARQARERQAEEDRRQARERAELERQAREQLALREAEERRIASEKAALERQQREARAAQDAAERLAREREERHRVVSSLAAMDIAECVADEFGCEPCEVAARIADIPHEDWVEISMTDQRERAA